MDFFLSILYSWRILDTLQKVKQYIFSKCEYKVGWQIYIMTLPVADVSQTPQFSLVAVLSECFRIFPFRHVYLGQTMGRQGGRHPGYCTLPGPNSLSASVPHSGWCLAHRSVDISQVQKRLIVIWNTKIVMTKNIFHWSKEYFTLYDFVWRKYSLSL